MVHKKDMIKEENLGGMGIVNLHLTSFVSHDWKLYGCFQKYGKPPKSYMKKYGFSIIFTIHFGG